MRNLSSSLIITKSVMKKNDLIETILFIINKILDYTSSLEQTTPTIFDENNQGENYNENISTGPSSNDESNNFSFSQKEEKLTLTDYFYFWIEKMDFNENLLVLTMMNMDKILASSDFILTEKNVKNILFSCMIITQKYYEDENFNDKDYSKLLKINVNDIIKMEVEFLSLIDFSLHITEEEFLKYKANLEGVWKKSLSFLNFE
jgi:hypothetical protein